MFTESATVRRINNQCRVWLHKPSGVKYTRGPSNGAAIIMQSASRAPKVVAEEELNNAEVWALV